MHGSRSVERATACRWCSFPGIQGRWEYFEPGLRGVVPRVSRHHVLARRTSRDRAGASIAPAGLDGLARTRWTACWTQLGARPRGPVRRVVWRPVALRFAARGTRARRRWSWFRRRARLSPDDASRDLREAAVALRAGVPRRNRQRASAGRSRRRIPDRRRRQRFRLATGSDVPEGAALAVAHGGARPADWRPSGERRRRLRGR